VSFFWFCSPFQHIKRRVQTTSKIFGTTILSKRGLEEAFLKFAFSFHIPLDNRIEMQYYKIKKEIE
jgi:hypothetical protein